MRSYYSKQATYQMQGVITRPTAGLNEYTPSTELNDNYLSEVLNVLPYRDQALKFDVVDTTLLKYMHDDGDNIGSVRAVLPAVGTDDSSATWVFYVLTFKADNWRILKVEYSTVTSNITTFVCTVASVSDGLPSACVFTTESETYYCFSFDTSDRIHFVQHNAGTYGYADLPFTPKKLIAHANRVFAIGSPNKLWWSRAGDLFSWYGAEYDNDYIAAEQAMKNGALTITTQPNTTRLITFTHRSNNLVDTLGSIDLVGTDFEGNAQSETIAPVSNVRVVSEKRYKTITSATQSGWVQAGGATDYISIGVGPVGSKYVQADAGYWTVEREPELREMCVLSGDLYLFGSHNIHVFQGFSYDTFNLQQLIADTGINAVSSGYKQHRVLAVSENTAYFRYGDDIYSFNGSSKPRVISRPVFVNGASTNGVFGGIYFTNDNWALVCDNKYLHLYQTDTTPTVNYRYDHEAKTWWKMSGITNTDAGTTDTINMLLVPSYSKAYTFSFVTINTAGAATWFFSTDLGLTQSTTYPYLVSKAFNTNPSEDGTLTDLILQVKGAKDTTANITVQYQLTDNGSTFTTAKTYSAHAFTGDTEILQIPLHMSYIHRAHHYRLKIIVQSTVSPVYLYNMERRFRTLGRSR
jgi:hypothetical protein